MIQWTSERLARYETAQFAIGMMVALRASWIAKEREQPNPDQAAVDLWVEEQGQLSEEGLALMLDDLEGIERVINEYGPVVRAAPAEA